MCVLGTAVKMVSPIASAAVVAVTTDAGATNADAGSGAAFWTSSEMFDRVFVSALFSSVSSGSSNSSYSCSK